MELREALSQITEIRQQMARAEVYRGYHAVPAAFSGMVALAAGAVQGLAIPDPTQQPGAYLGLWIGAAGVCSASAVTEMALRVRSAASPLVREQTAMAMEQFGPCLAVGGLSTMVIVQAAPACLWLLPGLWQLFYCLGVFATCRLLPRSMWAVAVFYALSGMFTLSHREWALSPWAMSLPFAVGQLLAAALLYRTLERDHDVA